MAFIDNNTIIFNADGSVNIPQRANATIPSSPTVGQVIYNTDTRTMQIYDGVWKTAADARTSSFLTRQIITTSYVCGGYKDSTPWKNVNRMVHATDVCTNLGDQIVNSGAYISGACNLTRGWFWGVNGTVGGANNTTVGFNMATETSIAYDSSKNTTTARDDPGTVFKEHLWAFIMGGGSALIDMFQMTTETMMGSVSQATLGHGFAESFTSDGGSSAISGETHGYVYGGTSGRVNFTTATVYSNSVATDWMVAINSQLNWPLRMYRPDGGTGFLSTSGQQKGINSKLGKGYFGNEGTYNGGYNLRRINFATDTNLGNVAKPVGNSGEENFDMGQAHQYMLGMYDGAQNNRGWKFSYSTESGSELGAGSIRTGVPGGSSGHCVWKG